MSAAFILHLLALTSFFFALSTRADLSSDRAALLSLRFAVRGRLLLWNLTVPPCTSWAGVVCDTNNTQQPQRVVELRLPGMGLAGQIPAGTIGNLSQLQTISLRFNSLSGPIPPDIASLSQLRNLYLQHNSFSGELPPFLFTLQNLIHLNLASNNFSGKISPAFNNLTRLKTLYLEQNSFTGSIPDLRLALDQFNVSSNKLTGSIPARLSGMHASAFGGGNSLCGLPLQPCKHSKLSGGAIAGIVIGSVLGFLLLLALLIVLCRRRKKSGKELKSENVGAAAKQVEVEMPREAAAKGSPVVGDNDGRDKASGGSSLVFLGKHRQGMRRFDLEDLLRASAEVLGKGTYGTTYKASLEIGVVVAVKRLKDVSVTEREFREKIEEIGDVDHDNLVGLRAYYYSRDEKLLVYDFMPTGSLSALLHGTTGAGRTPLNWDTRCNIALGAAHAIAYLHSRGALVSHGNIKSSNVLLTSSYEGRVSDFGLAHLGRPSALPNRVSGYRAPEVTDSHKISQKADVYSFGVLLLELLTGKAPTHSLLNEEGVDLPRWVQSVVKEEWTAEVFDVELLRYQDVEEDMVQLLQLALDCAAQYPDKRPSMAQVVNRIEEIRRSSMLQEQEEDHDFGQGPYSEQALSTDSAGPSSSMKG